MENKVKNFLINNIVPIFMIVIILLSIPVSGLTIDYLIQEIILRLSRNLFLVLSLLIPIIAGMGLNFGIVLGAMAKFFGLPMLLSSAIGLLNIKVIILLMTLSENIGRLRDKFLR